MKQEQDIAKMDIQREKEQLKIKNFMREKILIKSCSMKLRKSPRKQSEMSTTLKIEEKR